MSETTEVSAPTTAPAGVSRQEPGCFWKRFAAVAVLALVIIPIAIIIGIHLSKVTPLPNHAAGPPSSDGLVARWPADGNARDAVSDNDGVPMGDVRYSPGISGQAFSFDGRGAYVRIRSPLNFKIEDQVTVAFWMKSEPDNIARGFYQGLVTSDFYNIGMADYGGTMGVTFGVSTTEDLPLPPNGITTRSNFTSIADASYSGAAITPGVWYHIAATYDGAKLQLYVNGSPWGRTVYHTGRIREMLPGSFIAIGSEDGRTTCPVCIGHQYFKGLIEEVRIYKRALSAEEIQRLFRAVNPDDARPGRSPAN